MTRVRASNLPRHEYTLPRVTWSDLRQTNQYGSRDHRMVQLEADLAKIYAPIRIDGPLAWCEACQDDTPHNDGICAHCQKTGAAG